MFRVIDNDDIYFRTILRKSCLLYIFIIRWMRYFLIIICVSVCYCWNIEQENNGDRAELVNIGGVSGLKFNNYSGQCITQQQISKAIDIVNQAATYYGDYPFKNAQYIRNRMNTLYSTKDSYFYVYIMTERYQNWYSVYSKNGCSFI